MDERSFWHWSLPRSWTMWLVCIWGVFAVISITASTMRAADDCLFYLVVARNVAGGFGSTFNQVVMTNGYHPLWMWLLTPLAWLTSGTEQYLDAAFLVNRLQALVATLLLCDLACRFGSRLSAVSIAMAMIWFHALRGTALSEAATAGVMLGLAARCFLLFDRRIGRTIIFGVCCGLLALSRLDMVFLLAAMCVALLLERHRRRWLCVLVWGVSASAVLIPYLLWNLSRFGHLTPISGAMKSTFPRVVFRPSAIEVDYWMCLLVAYAAIVILRRVRATTPLVRLLHVVTGGATLQTVYIVFLTSWDTVWHWYYALHCLAAALGAGLLASAIAGKLTDGPVVVFGKSKGTRIVLGTMLFVLPVAGALYLHRGPRPAPAGWAAMIDEALPSGALCVLNDSPGILGLFAQTRFLPTDGLMGDYETHDMLKSLGPSETYRRLGAEYFCWAFGYDPKWLRTEGQPSCRFRRPGYGRAIVEVKSMLADEWVGQLELPEKDEVFRQVSVRDDGSPYGFILWKLER